MDTAYETETRKLVKAWVIGKDSSYIMPENDTFIANSDEIINHNEKIKEHKLDFIECRFKKGHDRHYQNGNISFITPHFFIPNKTKLGIETLPESLEHKKIKSFMHETFFNKEDLSIQYSKYKKKGETIYNKINLRDLDIDWNNFSLKKEDFFEVGVTDTFNTRRVDLFLPFKQFNPLFGEGLVIEVQLSPQTDEKTKERTIDRALKGYSCIWINKKDFEDIKSDNLIMNTEMKIDSWQAILHNNADNIGEDIYNKIKRYSRLIDLKCQDSLNKIKKVALIQEGMLCPKCNIGQLQIRTPNYGKDFLGCSEWKPGQEGCKQTYKLIMVEDIKDEE